MLKTFIKHHIYEYCIDLLFNGIQKNFTTPDMKRVRVGDIFKEVVFFDYFSKCNGTFTDVLLEEYKEIVFMGEKLQQCTFYSTCTEKDLIENTYVVTGRIVRFEK